MLNWRSNGNRGPEMIAAALQTWTRVGRCTDGLMPNLMPSASSFDELTRRTRHRSKAVPNTCMSLKYDKICAPVSEIRTERGPPTTQTSTLRYTLA